MPTARLRSLLAAVLALNLGLARVEGATLVATYDFQHTLSPQALSTAGANALTAVDPLGASGFVQDEVDGVPRTVWRFAGNAAPAGDQGGLLFTSGALLDSDAYTVELYFKFDEVTSWRRILDTSDRTSDVGFYVLDGGLQLFPSEVGVGSFAAATYHHVLTTFSGDRAVVYLDGIAQSAHATTHYTLPASGVLGLFLDNTESVAQHEYSAGAIAWARFYDGVLTAREAESAYHGAVQFDPADPLISPTEVPEPTSWVLLALCWPRVCRGRSGAAALRR